MKVCLGCQRNLPTDMFLFLKQKGRHVARCRECTSKNTAFDPAYRGLGPGRPKVEPLYCGGCKRVREPDDFYVRRSGTYSYPCKSCTKARAACAKYGITLERYAELRAREVCDLCGQRPRNRRDYAMHIDHDHATGVVRGVLCHYCNVMIGMARESPHILSRAIEWIGGACA